jgi:general secretion pathway protein D
MKVRRPAKPKQRTHASEIHVMKYTNYLVITLMCWLLAALHVEAQFFPGQGGGGGGGAANRARSTSSRTYPGRGDVGDAVISIDPETRSLIVIADEKTRQYISQVVSNLDRPKPQVLIKVVFVELDHNNSSDIGVEGAWGKDMGNNLVGALGQAFGLGSGVASGTGSNAPTANPYGTPIQAFQPIPPGAGVYQLAGSDYQVTLKAIAQSGRAKLLSRPTVVARNNQPATITAGQSVPLITNVRYDNFGNVINSVTYQNVGIILRVTPFITTDGMVEMILSPETSDLVQDRSQWVPISSGSSGSVSAPVINQRSADTVVVTPDGQTVIIGGLMYDSSADSESKIPLLGDIPGLGLLFKHKIKISTRRELLIFLTPHIIMNSSDMASLTQEEQRKASINKALTEQELNKFLDQLPAADPSGPNIKKTSKSTRP